VIDCSLMLCELFLAVSWLEQVTLSMRWWWGSLCSRATRWVELIVMKGQSAGKHSSALRTLYTDSDPISICSNPLFFLFFLFFFFLTVTPYCFLLSGEAGKYQFHCLLFDPMNSNPRSTTPEANTITITPLI
jgi:hypothetical protein